MSKASEIKSYESRNEVNKYYICESCHIGYPLSIVGMLKACHTCNEPHRGNYSFFDSTIPSLVDMIYEYYDLKSSDKYAPMFESHRIAIVIFYCTLAEVLMDRFLSNVMNAKRIPDKVQEKLMADNQYLSVRVEKLFPVLTGHGWKDSLGKAGNIDKFDYQKISKHFMYISKVRNNMVHRGSLLVEKGEIEHCIDRINPLIKLFVTLHNLYVHPFYYPNKAIDLISLADERILREGAIKD